MSLFVGVDIGGMSIKAGVVDDSGRILYKDKCITDASKHYSAIVKDTFDLVEKVVKDAGYTMNDISGIGIGCPGTVNREKGIVNFAGNLNFVKVPFVDEMKKHTDKPTFIANDANCAALGETKFGSGKNFEDTILVTLGTGVGSGIIINNQIFDGRNGEGAEAGHICIQMNGEKCTCGRRGCWEAYASATALYRQTEEALKKYPDSTMHKYLKDDGEVSGRTPFLAYLEGDKGGVEVVNNYVKYISIGIITLVNIFRPQAVMIGGGVSNEGEYFIKMIEENVANKCFGGKHNSTPCVVKATLGNDAGIVGAATLAM